MADSAKETQKNWFLTLPGPWMWPVCLAWSWICPGTRMIPTPSPPSITASTKHPSAPPNLTTGINSPREAGRPGRSSATAWGRQCDGESWSPGIIFQTQGRTWPAQRSQHFPEPQVKAQPQGFRFPVQPNSCLHPAKKQVWEGR